MSTSTVRISQLTLATPAAADHVAGSNAAGLARRFAVGELGTAHTHGIATVSGLQAALDGKASLAATNVLRVETLNGLNGGVTIEEGDGINVATQGSKITISATGGGGTGGGAVSSVNGLTGTVVLTSASVSAASAAHTHVIANVEGLQSALDAKAAVSATNVARVVSLAGLSGTIVVTGVNLTVATAAGEITLTAPVGGGGGGGGIVSVNGITATAIVLTHTSVSAAAASHTHAAGDVTSGTFDVARIPTHTHTIAQVSGLQTSLDGKASTSHASQHRAGGADVVLPVTTSTSITASVNNLTLPAGDIIRLSSTATGTAVITGLSGGAANQVRLLANVATNSIRLAHASTASGETNRFLIAGGADLDLAEGAQASAWYDADTGRWRVAAGSASTGGGSTATGGIVSVNGITATAVTLTSTDVSAASAVHTHTTASITGLDAHIATQATNAAVVRTLQGLTGTVTIVGVNLTVATAAGQITLTAPAGGGGGGGGIVSVNGQTATAVVLTHTDVSAAPANPVVTAVSLTASVNDYSLPSGDILRLSNTTTNNVNITGFGTAVDGASRLLINVSTGASSTYTIKHQDTNSTAVSRVIVPWAGDYVVSPNGGATLIIYDDTDDRWRVV